MNWTRHIVFGPALLLLFSFLLALSCKKEKNTLVDEEMTQHPRLMLLEGEEAIIKDLVTRDATWDKLHRTILKESNKILGRQPLERKMIGRRLLSTSREYLRRIFYLSYAYRMTADDRFLNHAEAHLLKAAAFSDWNPSHFLDVAEMTMGMAIGYDWLYHQLSGESREIISEAILRKGLEPSYDSKNNWFLRATHNWNQVCNAGMVFGAIALEAEHQLMRTTTIDRALSTIPLAMKDYGPDGAYPEGYGYWGYGTTMNVMLLSALQRADHSISDLTQTEGFLQTPEFMLHMLAPTGSCFNWGDNSNRGRLNPAMFWFADQRDDPSLLWSEKSFLEAEDYSKFTGERLLPALLIWSKDISIDQITEPTEKVWMGQGKNPIAIMRTSWSDPNALYVGFKAGSPSVNHGHMDVGSFILEADGVRWVSDLGVQNYESLESKGLSIFGKTQDAERWTIFRMNNFSHSTLIINDAHQKVDGFATIDSYQKDPDFSYAISDISTLYQGALKKAERGIAIKDQSYVILQDEVTTLDQEATLRWNVVTFAEPEMGDQKIILRKQGKQLTIQINGPDHLQLKTWSTAPTTDYDAENPGSIMVGFEVILPPNHEEVFEVLFIPEDALATAVPINLSLENW